MSIKSITKISKYGIFNETSNHGVNDFDKYNLIYGWNGSGKSTLSTVFSSIEHKSISANFPHGSFSITLADGTNITSEKIQAASLNIYTFNQDFIDQNIAWNSVVKRILLLDEKKIKEREDLDAKKQKQKADTELYEKELSELAKITTSLQKFGTDSARHIKSSLQSIDTSDKYYINYDKRKFETFIENNQSETALIESILDEKKLIEITNAAKPVKLPAVSFSKVEISSSLLEKAKERLEDIFKTTFISQTIDRLEKNHDISTWVESGLTLHKKHAVETCEFCGEKLSEKRLKELQNHFNDNYKLFQERLEKASEWLTSQYVNEPPLPTANEFYEEFKDSYIKAKDHLANTIKQLNEEIKAWGNVLSEKMKNPLETNFKIESISPTAITSFNKTISELDLIVRNHNHKTDNFEAETTKLKKQLELHYATTEIQSFGYNEKKESLKARTEKNSNLRSAIDTRALEINSLEQSLANEGIGAEKFNEALHRFLGRGELTLRFNSQKKGYEIIRYNTETANGKLSEGEKTAIALVYFMTKIKENGNKIEDSIIVVDDPVSSFDSNHLFHAYSFLRSNCENAKQLFVLTHNFTYFKLVRDWFEGVNRGRIRKQKTPNAFFYSIESSGVPRSSTIKNAGSSLIHYNSEYHYIFSRLKAFANQPSLSRDEAFLTANLARKLLESFFSFKYPKHRSDIAQLMERGLKDSKEITPEVKEKVYRFINKYSHSAVIEINEDSSENLVGEGQNVIGEIFKWIEEVDSTHYQEMLQVAEEV
ncbi:AAA family ATPase [Chitinilyticum litopenaei]|uniref:AAA family ATPase n=1 Tax=Chitinilyticum litopenaei TaxID=1121276 RepID=UPI0003F9D39C|nr:AAA family ATPase [Chitinilyticum litopenaei]